MAGLCTNTNLFCFYMLFNGVS